MSESISLRERIARPLRGKYNSVRYRFYGLPREWLSYLLRYRLRGRSWIDFYAARMDGFQKAGSAEKPLKAAYLETGRKHLEYMRRHGLEPHHAFLDYGCGVLRTGVPVIKYLEKGNYTGVDISQDRIDKGRRLARQNGIGEEAYQWFKVTDCHLREFPDARFDFVWAWSVINHMPAADIRVMLKAMRRVLKPDGRFLFIYNVADKTIRIRIKDWSYREADMRRWCEAAGLDYEVLGDLDEPNVFTKMVRATVSDRQVGA